MKYPIIGIAGAARSGKDTLCRGLIRELRLQGIQGKRKSIAGDTVKKDLRSLLETKLGLDTFTEDSKQKTLMRPLLVEYGRLMRQQTNGRYFIDQFKPEPNVVNIIPDIRYAEYPMDELDWVLSEEKGILIFIERVNIFDANDAEKINNKIIKEVAHTRVEWDRLDENDEADQKIIDSYARKIIRTIYQPRIDQLLPFVNRAA